MKIELPKIKDLRDHLSKLKYACDVQRSRGIEIPTDIPIDTYRLIKDGVSCMHSSNLVMMELISSKLRVDSISTLTDEEKRSLMKSIGEKETPKLSTCFPVMMKSDDVRKAANRIAR